MIYLLPKATVVKDNILLDTPITLPLDFFGIHANHWPINQSSFVKYDNALTGVVNEYTARLNSAQAVLQTGMSVVTQASLGVAIGAIINTISTDGLTLTLSQPNNHSFSAETVEFYGPGLSTIAGEVSMSPASLGYSWFRTHDSRWGAWCEHNPAPGVYNWTNTDILYAQYTSENKKILVTILGTPKFASARPLELGFAYGARGHGAEPENMQYFADYCIALATRYPLILDYELGNEAGYTAVDRLVTGVVGEYTIELAPVYKSNATGATGQALITLIDGGISTTVEEWGLVTGTGIDALTRVQSVTVNQRSGTIIQLSKNTIGAVSGELTFYATGDKMGNNGYVVGTGIAPHAKVVSKAANYTTVTLNLPNIATVNNPVKFYTGVNHFYSGTPEKIAEMTRIMAQAFKSINPAINIHSSPGSNIASPNASIYENATIVSDGEFLTIYKNTHNARMNAFVTITNSPNFNTPVNTFDSVISTGVNEIVVRRACIVGIDRTATVFHKVSPLNEHYEPSAQGYLYKGIDGAGTRLMDWVDIIDEHTYCRDNFMFGDTEILKKYHKHINVDDKPIWATEFGQFTARGVTGATCVAGNIYIPFTGTVVANSLNGLRVLDINDNFVGLVASNTTTVITLASPALFPLTGLKALKFFTELEIAVLVSRSIISMALCGFDKCFWYAWAASGELSLNSNLAAIQIVHDNIAFVAGKTAIRVLGSRVNGPITIYFSDGTSLTL